MDAHRLALADQTFDIVVCGSALDGFARPARALGEVHRVLRPGGTFGLWVAPRWWWEGDPRWDWHGCLQAAGFIVVTAYTDRVDLTFHASNEYLGWAASHGFRQVLDRLTPAQHEIYTSTVSRHVGNRGVDGRMTATVAVADKTRQFAHLVVASGGHPEIGDTVGTGDGRPTLCRIGKP